MTPHRQLWWNSLSTRERYIRDLIADHKRSIRFCKASLADECRLSEPRYYKKYIKVHKMIITLCKHELYTRYRR